MVFWTGYVSDEMMGTFAPIAIYWIYGGMYQLLPSSDRHRLHSLKEEEQKNLVRMPAVIKGVLLQQLVQATIARLLFLVIFLFLLRNLDAIFFFFSFDSCNEIDPSPATITVAGI